MRRRSRRLRQSQIDYLLLEVFGPRYLPNDVACRIALRAELARGLLAALERHDADRVGSSGPTSVEAVSA